MISLFNIGSIALYEMKNLVRSWFFRIFSILSLGILVLLNAGIFGNARSPYMLRALPSFFPYLNLLLLNVLQAVIGGFMASDFMKYDRKLDTTDVIYMRSMTNADYVFGKTVGVLAVFTGLNFLALTIAFVFNVFITDAPFLGNVYWLYPLLISLPTLVFIFGLSFLLMSILRNQALTFIILLGYIASTLFFLGKKAHFLFDYMAFNVPMTYSDFVGFGDMAPLIMQRSIYFLLGVSFIFMTVLLLKRLPQSRVINSLSIVVSISSIVAALFIGSVYVGELGEGIQLRETVNAINIDEGNNPHVSVTACDLDVEHKGDEIAATAVLSIVNINGEALDSYVFSLNPGLTVSKVVRNGADLPFTRNVHLLEIEPPSPLEPDSEDKLTIHYSGTLDDRISYPEVAESMRAEKYNIMLYNVSKSYGFITPRYVLLTTENLWYPIAGVPYGSAYPKLQAKDFIDFTLHVTTSDDLMAISQGKETDNGGGDFQFEPEFPMPRLSLTIGNYERLSVEVYEVEFNIYILEGHNYFSEFFTDIQDVLPDIIDEQRLNYEEKLGIIYPYKRFSIIETPIQYFTYPRLWTVAQETVQPEQILMPEKGLVLRNADFGQRMYFMNRHSRGGQQSSTPEEVQESLLTNFVSSTFTSPSNAFQAFRRSMGNRRGQGFSMRRLTMGALPNHYGNYAIFPLFYSYVNQFSSDSWPVITSVMEMFVNKRVESTTSSFLRTMIGLSEEEKSNFQLAKNNLVELLETTDDIQGARELLKLKSKYLFANIENEAGRENFTDFIDNMIKDNRFSSTDADEFISGMKESFSIDIEPHFNSLLYETELPAFIVSNTEVKEIIEMDKTLYQVTFTIVNTQPVGGLVQTTFRVRSSGRGGGDRGGRMSMFGGGTAVDPDLQHYIVLNANEAKEIGIVLEGQPASMTIDTFTSLNIPSLIEINMTSIEKDDEARPFEGERVISLDNTLNPREIIVDNEDPGFEFETYSSASFVKQYINRNREDYSDEYVGLSFWNMPRKWSPTTYSGFYGSFRRSAHYLRAGEGLNRAFWTAEIQNSGKYNVYCYVSVINTGFGGRSRGGNRGGGNRGGGRGGGRGRRSLAQDFHYTVNHDDGVEEIEIDMTSAQDGWYLLGTYYFSKGQAVVELTDESDGRVVYADAIKWTMQD